MFMLVWTHTGEEIGIVRLPNVIKVVRMAKKYAPIRPQFDHIERSITIGQLKYYRIHPVEASVFDSIPG